MFNRRTFLTRTISAYAIACSPMAAEACRKHSRRCCTCVACCSSALISPQLGPDGVDTLNSHQLINTNIPGVRAYLPLPANFNAHTASDHELALWGIPPRPNAEVSPAEHKHWIEHSGVNSTRVVPQLLHIPARNSAAKDIKRFAKSGGITSATSLNWSGIIIEDASNPFAAKNTQIGATYSVPQVRCEQFGLPTMRHNLTTRFYASQWVGIDGWSSNDVLQCGTATNISCPHETDTFFWIEWFPAFQVQVSNLGVSPGHRVSILVNVISSTQGNCTLTNSTTGKSVTLSISAPGGTALIGNCVEWVIERTSVNGNLALLPNYGSVQMTSCLAKTSQSYYPGSSPGNAEIYNCTMSFDNKPASMSTVPSSQSDTIDFKFATR